MSAWLAMPSAKSALVRWYCWRARARLATRAARVSSWLRTVACCLAGSIWTSGVPGATRSPERTKIRVTCPSTWGMMAAESRERSVAT